MKRVFTALFIFVFSLVLSAQVINVNWEWKNPYPNGNDQNAVVALSSTNVLVFGAAGSVQKSTAGGTSWTINYVDESSRDIKAACFVNPTTGFLCGTAGLLMKTTDAGNSWTALSPGTTEDLLSVDFYDKDTGYVSGSNGLIMKTTNGGNTWAISSYGTSYIYKVYIVSPSNVLLGSSSSTTGRIIRSTNYGASWASVTPAAFTSGTVYGISFGDANTGVAVSSGLNIYKTTDAGATWVAKTTTLGSNVIYSASFISPTKVLATDAGGNICVSTDAGETWSIGSTTKSKLYAVDFFNNDVYVTGSAGTILRSDNGGASFGACFGTFTQEMLRGIQFFDAKNGLACGGATSAADGIGQMLKTTDGGNSWGLLPFNFTAQVYCFARPSQDIWYAATNNNKIFKTTDGGVTFTQLTLPVTGTTQTYWDMAATSNDVVYAGGASGKLIKTTDGGNTWTTLTHNFGTNVIYKIRIVGNAIYLAGAGAKLSKSTDGGATWAALTPNIPGTFFGLGFKDQNLGYVVGSSLAVAKTTDGGTTWVAQTMPSSLKSTTSLWSVAFTDSAVWVSSINGDVLYSNDGLNWQIAKKITSNNLFSIATVGNDLFIAGSGGTIIKGVTGSPIPVELTSFAAAYKNNSVQLTWKTATETNNRGFEIEKRSTGGNWAKIGFVAGNGNSTEIKHYSFVDAAVNGKAFYRLKQIDFDGSFNYSGIVEVNAAVPGKFELAQNYPNPFNPTTGISFKIAQQGKVSLKVYNVIGKEVASLVDGVKAAGSYTVQFNASNLSSGVYYYTLKTNEFTSTKKMVLIK